jgi:CheY-like chemotaxis protein
VPEGARVQPMRQPVHTLRGTRSATLDAPVTRPVLIVDPDTRNGLLLARMLREDGFTVETVFDGASAIARLTRDPVPAVLVSAVALPNVSGNVVAGYARWRSPTLPLVFVTRNPQLLDRFEPKPIVHTKPLNYAVLASQLSALATP